MEYKIELKVIPPRNVMSIRKIVDSYPEESLLWQELQKEVERQNVQWSDPPQAISFYHDEEQPKPKDIDMEVQCSVIGNYTDTETVKFFTAPEMTVVSVTIQGGYENVAPATAAAREWMKKNGYRQNGSELNINIVSAATELNPDNWVTEVCYQVEAV